MSDITNRIKSLKIALSDGEILNTTHAVLNEGLRFIRDCLLLDDEKKLVQQHFKSSFPRNSMMLIVSKSKKSFVIHTLLVESFNQLNTAELSAHYRTR